MGYFVITITLVLTCIFQHHLTESSYSNAFVSSEDGNCVDPATSKLHAVGTVWFDFVDCIKHTCNGNGDYFKITTEWCAQAEEPGCSVENGNTKIYPDCCPCSESNSDDNE